MRACLLCRCGQTWTFVNEFPSYTFTHADNIAEWPTIDDRCTASHDSRRQRAVLDLILSVSPKVPKLRNGWNDIMVDADVGRKDSIIDRQDMSPIKCEFTDTFACSLTDPRSMAADDARQSPATADGVGQSCPAADGMGQSLMEAQPVGSGLVHHTGLHCELYEQKALQDRAEQSLRQKFLQFPYGSSIHACQPSCQAPAHHQ